MTEFRYLQVMSEASDILLATVGLDEAYVETGHSVYTVETHIRPLAEATLGEQMWLHVDMKAGCTTPFKPPLKENMAALAAAHAHLPLPVGAGVLLGEGRGEFTHASVQQTGR